MNKIMNLFLSDVTPLLKKGVKQPLQQEDVELVVESERGEAVYAAFCEHWTAERSINKENASLWRALLKTIGLGKLVFGVFLSGISAGCAIGPPLILKAFSDHFSGQNVLKDSILWILVGLLFALPVLSSVCMAWSYVFFSHAACKARNVLTPAVYRKALLMGSDSKSKFSSGRIINLFSVDITMIQMFFQLFGGELFAPAQLGIALGLVYREVGVAMFSALGFIFAILPVLLVCFVLFAKFRQSKNKPGDMRVKLTNELLSGIRIVKYYAWEKPFFSIIDKFRDNELGYLSKLNFTMVIIVMLITSIPYILPIVVFYTYTNLNGEQLDVGKAFTTLALLGLVTGPMSMIPSFIQRYFQAKISMRRLNEFLVCEELQQYIDEKDVMLNDYVISLNDASLSWLKEDTSTDTNASTGSDRPKELDDKNGYEAVDASGVELTMKDTPDIETKSDTAINRSLNTLMNLSFNVKAGELVAIVGGVGSGKSSLLCALLGDLQLLSGKVCMRPSTIAYHSQQPWILNNTVKDNITFGLPFDEQRFQRAIDASCLQSDIAILPNGIDTEIGEKGINLSGGQKARVSFARAVYRDADVYLLDDPLSAVDAHVGVHLFEDGICGALKGKTIILVTHQVHLLEQCDKLLVLKDGHIVSQGTPEEVRKAGIKVDEIVLSPEALAASLAATESPPQRHRTISGLSGHASPEAATREMEYISIRVEHSNDDQDCARVRAPTLTEEVIETLGHIQNSAGTLIAPDGGATDAKGDLIELYKSDSAKSVIAEPENGEAKYSSVLMSTEERHVGEVSWDVYQWYMKLGGIWFFIFAMLVALGGSGAYAYSSFWLAEWGNEASRSYTEDYKPLSDSKNEYYLNIYAVLCSMGIVSTSGRAALLVVFGVRASRLLHTSLMNGILNSPVSFFDSTPLGRILNRFTSDITSTDENLASNISFVMGMMTSILAAVGAICYSTKGVLLALFVPLSFVFYQVQLFYRKTNTELKRLDNVSRSPIYAQFDQALVGVTSLRAYNAEDQFQGRLHAAVDVNSGIVILQQVVKWWVSIRVETIGGLVSCFLAALAVGWDGFLSDRYLSLSLNFSFALVGYLKWIVSLGAEVEATMSSIERIKYYCENLIAEEPEEMSKKYKPVPQEWPHAGNIVAKNVKMAYRTGPMVLKGISFDIQPKEKIGIVGRTGCGKSSLMVALFRVENISSGSIVIDGIDTSTVALKELRPRLGIIPQDPVIFSVTVRFNLDPFNDFSDAEIWDVLESVDMKESIVSLPLKLQEPVSDGGDSFSVGQKQLICIARVLLRKPKILVLDEATASVDNETDDLIQTMVREKFKQCTVLTIAHRLHTVIDSDRIMALSAGVIEEFDKPSILTEKENGLFAGLWKQHNESRK